MSAVLIKPEEVEALIVVVILCSPHQQGWACCQPQAKQDIAGSLCWRDLLVSIHRLINALSFVQRLICTFYSSADAIIAVPYDPFALPVARLVSEYDLGDDAEDCAVVGNVNA